MTDMELDGMMRHVLLDALRNDEEDRGADIVFIPSKNHLRQMQRMLQDPLKWLRSRTRPAWKVVVQKVAIILLIVSIAFGGVMVVSPTARASVTRWVLEVYETQIVYRFSGEDISGPMPQYGIADLPEGYVETDRRTGSASVSIMYENDADGILCLDYAYMQQGVLSVLAPGDDDIIPVTVGNFDGEAYVPKKPTSAKAIVWMDRENNIHFIVKGFGAMEDILHMANSVSLIDGIKNN